VETGEEGIEVLRKEGYDVIIVDYRLPGMDGLEFFRRIQSWHPYGIKILITAYPSEEIASEATQIGLDDFIVKPLTCKNIEDSLCRIFRERDT
jgi:YesN/AraC family two-component response regulator